MPAPYNSKTTGSELVQELADQIKGKVILTSGVTPGGLGAQFVELIATAQPALLILTGRNTSKPQQTADAIAKAHPDVKTRILKLDLGSLAVVREAAAELNSWDDVPVIDVLVNNAAIMATDFALSPDGFESQFATNHLGHFLFTNLIINKVLAAKEPRIVSVSSDGHRLSPVRFDDNDFHGGENYNRWQAYGQSKTANMLFALSLAEKLGEKRGLVTVSLHPGVIGGTNLGTHIDWTNTGPDSLQYVERFLGNKEGWSTFQWKTHDEGVATHVFASFDQSLQGEMMFFEKFPCFS
ncbi:putative dehydrogenase [Podospora australis]|uniref:Dehydrogenase n=1 Tax=Podospora australis TaxID=1536484 RepID=A0AAN6WUW0_9PEZI|nr:putative dehydrogenase [Podospora australis]